MYSMPKKIDIKSFEENIRNYGDEIETLSFIEAVRKVPGMYIGAIGNIGWKSCIREIAQNAFDEAVKAASPCNYIRIYYDERNHSVLVEDNGRGVPHGQMIGIYSEAHSSSNYTKQLGEYSSGVHGVGSGVAMGLSKKFVASSYVLGKAHQVTFYSGILTKEGEENISCPKGRQGTSVYMEPDETVLGHIDLNCKEVYDMIFSILPLLNIGDQIDFTGIGTSGGTIIYEEMINTDGIITDLKYKTQTPLITPIVFRDDTGTMKAEIALTYDSSDLTSAEDITSFSNFTPTSGGGTHVDGFLDGLCNYLRNYMNKIYLGDKSKLSISNIDIKTGLKAIVNVAHLNPIFKGQFKGILSNEDMGDFVKKLTLKALDDWTKTSPGELQKVCKFIKEIAEIRVKSEGEKIKLSSKYTTNQLTGKPQKYVQPSGNKNLELFIVEGNSALGPAKNGRDYTCQGIFPIKGKLPNAFKEGRNKFLSNAEVAAIISLVGGGYGRDFDISKVKWEKVICLADADADGGHIDTLLLRLFLVYMPGLIEAGKLYRAVPALYGIKQGKNTRYFASTVEFTKYVQFLFSKQYVLESIDNHKIAGVQATSLFYNNRNYTADMEIMSNTFAIDSDLLESVLYEIAPYIEVGSSEMTCNMAAAVKKKKAVAAKKTTKKVAKTNNKNIVIDENEDNVAEETLLPVIDSSIVNNIEYFFKPTFNFKKMADNIKKKYRFLKVSQKGDIIVLEGLVNSRYQYIFLNDNFIRSCIDLILMIKNTEPYYKINGNEVSIYGLMKAYEDMTPNGLTRYKGLGEQSEEELGESALKPNSSRTLIQYSMETAKAEIENIRYIESNMSSLLRNTKVDWADIE